MNNSFHYHLTIADITVDDLKKVAKHLKAKPTTIDLIREGVVKQDRMVTKYSNKYREIRKQLYEDVEFLKDVLGYSIVRAKIEQTTEGFSYRSDALYSEAHIKVADEDLVDIPGLHLSNNPVEGTRFYNAKAFDEIEFYEALTALDKISNIKSEQYELCLFDSNMAHDEWWTRGGK